MTAAFVPRSRPLAGAERAPDGPYFPNAARLPMSQRGAEELVRVLREAAGVRVEPKNRQFLRFRLDKRLRALGMDSYDDYVAFLKSPEGADERQTMLESLVTHTTSFFRERQHYDWLRREGLPRLIAQGAGRLHPLTIWSAACSTGPELWSAGMVLSDLSDTVPGGLRWGLVGSDISETILSRAARAIYGESEVDGLTEAQRRAFLLRSRPGKGNDDGTPRYRIVPELRARAKFVSANLLHGSPDIPQADVIFLRNVLIYFGPEDRTRALRSVLARLRRGGVLIVGHSDTMQPTPPGLTWHGKSIYFKE